MKRVLALFLVSALAACGLETATTAATSAEIKRREMEQAKNTMEQAKQRIEQSTQKVMERTTQTDDRMKD